jgi:hypothetical protein
MADNKQGRDKQADDESRRQRERDVVTALERIDEPEPPRDTEIPDDVADTLDTLAFPASGETVVSNVGERHVETDDGTYTVADLIPDTDAVSFDSAGAVRVRLQRPTVADSMRRIVVAVDEAEHERLSQSQYDAYERTLSALKAVDADDDDESVGAITAWLVEQIGERQKPPGSRAVRKEAAGFCRKNGYPIRDDEWLGA